MSAWIIKRASRQKRIDLVDVIVAVGSDGYWEGKDEEEIARDEGCDQCNYQKPGI